jgi:hypothetical protein
MLSGDDLTIVLFFVGTAISIAGTAMSAAGWRHPVLIGGLFSLAGVCFVAGMAWPVLKTISPPATAMVGQVATNPVAWFAVLILGMTASLLLPKRISGSLEQRDPTFAAALGLVRSLTTPTKPKKDNGEVERIFVDATPAYLTGLLKDRLVIHGQKLVEPYIGKWLSITGAVTDVDYDSVTMRLDPLNSISSIYLHFDIKWKGHIHTLRENQQISVIGKIVKIELFHLTMVHCELIVRRPDNV